MATSDTILMIAAGVGAYYLYQKGFFSALTAPAYPSPGSGGSMQPTAAPAIVPSPGNSVTQAAGGAPATQQPINPLIPIPSAAPPVSFGPDVPSAPVPVAPAAPTMPVYGYQPPRPGYAPIPQASQPSTPVYSTPAPAAAPYTQMPTGGVSTSQEPIITNTTWNVTQSYYNPLTGQQVPQYAGPGKQAIYNAMAATDWVQNGAIAYPTVWINLLNMVAGTAFVGGYESSYPNRIDLPTFWRIIGSPLLDKVGINAANGLGCCLRTGSPWEV